MAYDSRLADRTREAVGANAAVSERQQFGGVAFLIGGNVACGIIGDDLLVRVGPSRHDEAMMTKDVRALQRMGGCQRQRAQDCGHSPEVGRSGSRIRTFTSGEVGASIHLEHLVHLRDALCMFRERHDDPLVHGRPILDLMHLVHGICRPHARRILVNYDAEIVIGSGQQSQ